MRLPWCVYDWWKRSRLGHAYWWLIHRVHPRHRYNMVRIGPPGYYDPCERIFFACIEEVRRFVKYHEEVVGGEPHEDPPWDEPEKEMPVAAWWVEAKDILSDYEKWKILDYADTQSDYEDSIKLRDQLLHRVADIHQFLWD